MAGTLSNLVAEGTVAKHADGRTAVFRNGRWNLGSDPAMVNIDRTAPGAAFLPQLRQAPGKSEEAYFRQWREKNDPAIGAARNNLNANRRLEDLLTKQETGGWYSVPLIGDGLALFDPEAREINSISSEMARGKRQPGEGAISDFDAKQFLNMSPGIDKPTETNRNMVRAQRMADDAAIQQRQFKEWHYNNFGTVSGAEEAWDRYAQDNPIFVIEKDGSWGGKLNEGRKNWRQYFGDVRTPRDATPSASYQDIKAAATRPRPGDPRTFPQKPSRSIRFEDM